MKLHRAAIRYAKALMQLSIERNDLEVVNTDIVYVKSAVEASKELATLMMSEVVQEPKKANIYKALFEGKISELTLNFMLLLAKNHRSAIIPSVLKAFEEQYKSHKNIHTVNITAASKMDEAVKSDLVKILQEKAPGSTVEINETINEDLIGGFVIRTKDHQIDASVANRLKGMKRDLINTTYTSKL
jgi:F-type H+-transporting ATPase subunit delta